MELTLLQGDCALLFVKNFHNVEVIGTDSGFPVLTYSGNVNMFLY